jgi:hypothetical protein
MNREERAEVVDLIEHWNLAAAARRLVAPDSPNGEPLLMAPAEARRIVNTVVELDCALAQAAPKQQLFAVFAGVERGTLTLSNSSGARLSRA